MLSRISLDESEAYIRDMIRRHGLSGVCILALTNENGSLYPNCNRDAMELKRRIPGCYAFGSLEFDGDVPTHEEFFLMLEQVLVRHPKLRLAVAHMGYYYEDLPRPEALMEHCPNFSLDMTPPWMSTTDSPKKRRPPGSSSANITAG